MIIFETSLIKILSRVNNSRRIQESRLDSDSFAPFAAARNVDGVKASQTKADNICLFFVVTSRLRPPAPPDPALPLTLFAFIYMRSLKLSPYKDNKTFPRRLRAADVSALRKSF
ncbi:hypothetical protein EVAR_102434_1 [Eumeta japonica]|uniref:Uncharacterized protein n=1 Tax=Eumeta variegata TaxID=151549 RepID=A0A4C1Z0C1_EUMVA|nr:hypothetical protein EVAR_102434_1 [Eumeta japonica]